MASTAPSANPGRCLRSGVLGPPALSLASGWPGPWGSGPVRSAWSRPAFGAAPVPWHRIVWLVPGSVAPWIPLAGSSTGCCGTASVSRVRGRAQPTRFSASLVLAVSPRPGLGPLASAGREAGHRRGPAAPSAFGPPLPFRWAGVAHPQRVAGGGGAPPGSPGGPAAGLVVGACRSPVSRSGVGIWLRTLGAFVAPRVG